MRYKFLHIKFYRGSVDYVSVFIYTLLSICILATISLIIATGFYYYDEATREPYAGIVIDKYYKSGYTTYVQNNIGGVITNTPITDSDEWRVVVNDGTDKPKTFEVTEKQFHKINKGDYVKEDK